MRTRPHFLVAIWISIWFCFGYCQRLEEFRLCLTQNGVDTAARLVERGSISRNNTANARKLTYSHLNRQWNHCCQEVLTPAAYLVVQSFSDIQAAVRCSRRAGVRIVAKGGGHSFAKYSYGDSDSVIVDLRDLNYVHVNVDHPESQTPTATATIGAGMLLGPLNYKLYHSESGRHWAIPTGDCQYVGIPFLLGGGHSDYSRLHGMGVDRVLEMKMVDAVGELRTVNNESNPELFWALLGAGSGSFGIVTEFKLSIYTAPKAVVFATLVYNTTDFLSGGVFQAWHKLAAAADESLPRNVHAYLKMYKHKINVHLIELLEHKDGDAGMRTAENDTLQDNIKTIMAQFPPEPVSTLLRTLPYLEYVCKHGQSTSTPSTTGGDIHLKPEDLQHIVRNGNGLQDTAGIRSYYVPYDGLINEKSHADLSELDTLVQDMHQDSGFYFQLLGGAINEPRPDDMAFAHRDSAYLVQFGYMLRQHTIATSMDPTAEEWSEKFWKTSARILKHKESYQNYVDPTMETAEYLQRYYGTNLQRLVSLKAAVDPDNVFHHPQSIPVRHPQ